MKSEKTFSAALVTLGYTGEHWEKIEKSLYPAKIIRCKPSESDKIAKALQEAEIAILDGDIDDNILENGKRLKWIHCNHAGINNSAKPEIFERGIILTGSAGRSAPVLAEHTFYLLLSLIYRSRLLEQQQREHVWQNIYTNCRGLYGKTMGIIGFGHTGREIAVRAKAFNMKVLAYDREFKNIPENADRFFDASKGDDYYELLRESDVVVLAVSLSDKTFHMIDKHAFSIMKDTALLINMARGAVVDEKSLADALRNGDIEGAGSDVFEVEPLQTNSPLWDLPNMVITPHCTPEMPDMPGNCVKIICDNIRLFREGVPLINAIDKRDVYTKNID
ncbi:MAG: D-2-hydroxyacid dehydrogenase [Oscillospiraceae bacterium]|jgi:phosphoglycerate dehydrogenase-like enzyme|nr:D-2-hydroxyacid dehydrogenase [Oscillospiraceae bacterium]